MNNELTFSLLPDVRQRVDVSPLTPDRLEGLNHDAICCLVLHVGNREVPVTTLFKISGSNSESIRFENPRGLLDCVGKAMSYGLIEVDGDAGSYLGMGMRGGRIVVGGSVDAYGAAELRSGTILIEGNAGDFLAAALPGNKKGMSGGFLRVRGNVGDRAGDHMRRGIILIEGDAGEYLGSRMTAGTMIVLGSVGAAIGYGMNRGTLLLARWPARLDVTFSDCGTHSLGFLNVLFRGSEFSRESLGDLAVDFARVRRFAGDLAALGRGEILIADSAR